MHHLPIVQILVVVAIIFGPFLLKVLKGGSSAGAGAGAGSSAGPRPNPRAAFAQMAEMARELDTNDPDAIKSLFVQMERQVRGAQPGPSVDAPSASMTFETTAVASALTGFAQRLTADPVLNATLEKAKHKREKKREPKPAPDGRVSLDAGLGAREPISPLAPLRPKKVLVPLPMLAARAPQRPIAL